MNSRRSTLFVSLLVLVAGGIAWQSYGERRPISPVTYTTLAGKAVTSNDLRGKVVLVNFWATTCAVCAREMPQIVATYQAYAARGFEVVAVAMPYDRPDWVVDYARRRELPFMVALDFDGTINRAFGGVEATPTGFLIDKQGKILQRVVGPPDFTRLRTTIERELDKPAQS